MKILCISDQIDALVYSSFAKERFSDIDAILCAGDLPSDYIDFVVSTLNKPAFFIFGNHNLKDFSYYHKNSVRRGGPHPTVLENPSVFDLSGSFGAAYVGFRNFRDKKLLIADPRTKKKRPLLISGISGSKRYNAGLNQYTERQMAVSLIKLIPGLLWNKIRYGSFMDIFLTHTPPRGVHDREDPCHQGFEVFNKFLKFFPPAYMVHGHIHLYDQNDGRISKINFSKKAETCVINAFSHYVFELYGNSPLGEDFMQEKQ